MVFLNKNSDKKVYQNLINIVGLGQVKSKFICKKLGFQDECTLKDLNNLSFERLKNHLSKYYTVGTLVEDKVNNNVKFKIDLGTYKGKRHMLGYPVRGQRTLSNGKTQRHLHKFRFKYGSSLLNHSFFKNQRKNKKQFKNFKKKKIIKELIQ